MRPGNVVSHTKLVTDFLRALDDFATASTIRAATRLNGNQTSAALCWLRVARVVDAVDVRGVLWWFALPPEADRRSKTFDEHVADIQRPRAWRTAAKRDRKGGAR